MFAKKINWGFLVVLLFAIEAADSTVIRPLDVASLTSQADLIVVGEVISIADRGPTTLDLGGGPLAATHFAAVLRADQVIKGVPAGQTLSLEFSLPQMPTGIQGILTGQYGMFFLSAVGTRFAFTDLMYPSLPAIPNAQVSSGPALDQVTSVLGEVLEATSATDSDRDKALDALGRLRTDAARNALRHALNSSPLDIQLEAARTLVAYNDIAGLALVEHALLNPGGLSERTLSNLAGSLAGLKDPRSVPALTRLLRTGDQRVIRAAAIGLRQSGSAEALGPLSKLLDNNEELVRYYAVVGLGEITRRDGWTPAFDEFRSHQNKYLSYWRDWAESNLPAESRK